MRQDELKYLSSLLPELPGIYQFHGNEGKILYIGKAKNLKKRVSSYFQIQKNKSNKIKVLVKQISKINHFVVENESEALLLENNLIKKYQPKYNVLLKDDKTFPWICIKNERFPRVFSTRNLLKDGSEYFGPYTSAQTVKSLLELIRQLYKLRTCNYLLSKKNIDENKFKICLEYHIGNCNGPCENLQDEQSYNESIHQIRDILKGNLSLVISHLKKMMEQFSNELKFEEANLIKNKIDSLEKFQIKSTVVNPKIVDADVFSLIDEKRSVFINYIKVVNGAIIHSHNIEIVRRLDESQNEILLYAITNIRERFKSSASEIILPLKLNVEFDGVKFLVPQQGDKKKLLDLSVRNANFYRIEKLKKNDNIVEKKKENSILRKLQSDLRLKDLPTHIECFDNSNIQGKFPVASCVVFKNGLAKRNEYRHFNIKTVEGANDFASMEEIIFRRYKRLLEEKNSLPQLIIIDGGKGQLNMAVKSLEKLEIKNKIAIIGIAKKLEKIFFPNDPIPLYIDKNSSSLKLIQKIRNEAHRFGITFHRLKRTKATLKLNLEEIPGIGKNTIEKLFNYFGEYSNIEQADINDLERILDKRKAQLIKDYFQNTK